MNLRFFQLFITLLMCLAFIGQSMASTVMTYNMMNMKIINENSKENPLKEMPNMAHCNTMKSSIDNTSSDSDCCSYGCHCIAFSHAKLYIFPHVEFVNDSNHLQLKILSQQHLIQSHIPNSWYKPPIIS